MIQECLQDVNKKIHGDGNYSYYCYNKMITIVTNDDNEFRNKQH